MIEINLLPEEFKKKEPVKFALPEVPIRKTLTVFLGIFFGLQGILTAYTWYQKLELFKFSNEVVRLTAQTKETAQWKTETAFSQNRLKEADLVRRRNFLWTVLLNEISDSMTKGVWLRDFSVQEGQEAQVVKKNKKAAASSQKVRYLKLEGSVIGPGQETAYIGKFLKELKDRKKLSGLFDTIEISNINQKKIKDFDVYDFTVVCVFKRDRF